ncbi:alpha/beta fold hydrolase [Pseudarthrobacter sp. J75]|uniref:alpha/beta fold hydrolase n=1 Tax=unclassified Pseudarthrobacter TaxID=2647000 RepID=UPI002E813578|nr:MULTISPECIES: alpha/beta fold hydrolase [unclassified Pseudarthrobacter]MEE2523695.1 alpha/beta fold hydrolase [Pseudarthrobacter sp. J47]MEE2530086.1 alpha/beta fold hydrolase [Pseudarthrobacter sp. J75]
MVEENAATEHGWLDVRRARIYWETTGNPDGVPVLYLHGGPGSSLGTGGYRRQHDPDLFWTIGLDQRGCGKSTPLVQDDLPGLALNTTATLIEDVEVLRRHLGVEQWIVTGGSWGSTLALAYALEHPDRVLGIAVVAVTTTSREEVDWITEGVGSIFPEAWAAFAESARRLPGERVVEAYARRLAGADREDARAAALAWDQWESTHISLDPRWQPGPMFQDEQERLTFATLVTHYWANDGFLTDGREILPRIHELNGIPGHLIHGRRDISGPVITPWKIHQRWDTSRLTVIEDEGHGGPESAAALASAVAELGSTVRFRTAPK